MGNTFYYKSGSLAFGLKEEQAEIFFQNLKIESNLRPTINGTGILLSGEAAGLPGNIMFTTGDQTVEGTKTFSNKVVIGQENQEDLLLASGNSIQFAVRPTVNGSGIALSNDIDSKAITYSIIFG